MQTTISRFQLVRACANSDVTGVVMAGLGVPASPLLSVPGIYFPKHPR